MRYFCTYFDQNYLSRGLALHASLRRHCPSFQLWILCMDEATHAALTRLALPGTRLICQDEFERGDAPLLTAKANRSIVEYYFTCTPSLLLHVLRHHEEVDILTYLDADLYFFSDLEPIFAEFGDRSIGIIAHRFTPEMRHLEFYGLFNVGLLVFRRDAHGLACMEWWRERCIEWCYNRAEGSRFGDQKYLDDWPNRFPGVVVLAHKGANVAVWNLGNYTVALRSGGVFVDEQPLIFFHYHSLKTLRPWLFSLHAAAYRLSLNGAAMRGIFAPYFAALFRAERAARRLTTGQPSAPTRPTLGGARAIMGHVLRRHYALVVRGWMFSVPEGIAALFQSRHRQGHRPAPATIASRSLVAKQERP